MYNQFECISTDTCTESKCKHIGDTCTSTTCSTTSTCTSEQIYNSIRHGCKTGRKQKQSLCKTYDSSGTQIGGYNVDINAKIWGKNIIRNNGDSNYYRENIQGFIMIHLKMVNLLNNQKNIKVDMFLEEISAIDSQSWWTRIK